MNRTLTVSRSMAIGDCFAAPNSVGPGAHTGFLGTTSVGANGFVLTAAGAPPIEFGLFYYGPEAAQVPFGDGFRCVGPGDLGLFRLQPPLTTDAAGALARAVDLTNPPEPAGTIGTGSTWSFQFWYRDLAAGGTSFNLSDALRSTCCA